MRIDLAQRHYREAGRAMVAAMAAAEAGDYPAEAAALRQAAHSLHAWAVMTRAMLPASFGAPKPLTKEERAARRKATFPEIGSKGPSRDPNAKRHRKDPPK